MDITYYEQSLSKQYRGSADAEERWDAKAQHFNQAQKGERTPFVVRVIESLEKRGALTGASVLDIGGGSGRYAIPFASRAAHVTITDISANMLSLAKKNAEEAGLGNLSYDKMEWEKADLEALGWNEAFDLAFASMCPAIRSPQGLRNMIASSRKACQINQFIHDTDTLTQHLEEALDLRRPFDPHNDRDSVQAIFNILWLQKYTPELTYIRQTEHLSLSVDEAWWQYSPRFGQAAQDNGVDLKTLIEEQAREGVVQVTGETTLAMTHWNV